MNEHENLEYQPQVTSEPWEEKKAPAKKSKKKTVIAIVAIVLAVALLAGGVLFAVNRLNKEKENLLSGETVDAMDPKEAHHVNAHGYPSWSVHFHNHEGDTNLHYYYLDESATEISVASDDVNTMLGEVVAACGESKLTNRELQYYYNEELYNFYNTYYDYISYMIDTSAPMDAQKDTSGAITWQKNFLDGAIAKFNQIAALCQNAAETGYTLTADEQAYIDGMLDLETMAMYYGYPDAISMLKEMIGPMATVESYRKYMEDTTMASFYLSSLANGIEVTAEEIDAYYEANKETYQSSYNLQKIDKNVMNVRHVLLQPETAEDGTITEEAWAATEAQAQQLLDAWKSGEATEDTFAQMANDNSTDPGSNTNGGLYEDVYPGQMVEEFNDWCFDDARQSGDTGIVKTSYGYHIMYYVSQGDYIYWQKTCEDAMRSERAQTQLDEIVAMYETAVDLPKVILLDAGEATVPSTEGEVTVTEE